jgi:CspA family cold shock protein
MSNNGTPYHGVRTSTDGKASYEHVSFPKSQDTEWPKRHKARSNETPTGKDDPMRLNGTVKFFNYARGFGFIAPDNGEKDVFVHTSALPQSGVSALKEGDKVSFETEDDMRGRGKKAAKVEPS